MLSAQPGTAPILLATYFEGFFLGNDIPGYNWGEYVPVNNSDEYCGVEE